VSLADQGAWAGTIDIPAQGVRSLALADVTVEGPAIAFTLPGVPGSPAFNGTVAPDGATIAGSFTQAGQTFPFSLRRTQDPARAAADALAGFDEFVESALKSWHVPGAAVAVVKDGQVVLAKGYGLRNVSKNLPVTVDTLFAIGSSTKAFTTLAMGILVDEGKLAWDEPVAKYLPAFALKDTFAGQRMTPRDLVTHRAGLPRHDLVWYNAKLSRKELVERLPYLEPNAGFREKFQYQNLMFLTAGYLVGEVAGTSWEDVLRTRVFEPLGMSSSNFSVLESQKGKDFASPYELEKKVPLEIPFRDITTVGPAGSINSSARDMSKWLLLQLGDGRINGRQVVAARQLGEMHRPQMVIESFGGGLFDDKEVQQLTYGLGWFVESYRGHKHVHHGGAIDGFMGLVSFLPDDGVGVVVLTNLGGNPFPTIVAREVSDRLLGLDRIDWNARYLKRWEVVEKAGESAKLKAVDERKPGTKPGHALEEYAGEYDHPAYGTVTIAREGGALNARFHDIPMRLAHWHYETFRGEVQDKALSEAKLFFDFHTDVNGEVDSLTVPLEPLVAPIPFRKRPPSRLSDADFLKRLVGEYAMTDNPEFKVAVALSGSVLALSAFGQPPIVLEPAYGTTFALKGLAGFSARFIVGETGAATSLRLIQPDGVYTLNRSSRGSS
jgi:CubicO group peptidase (beta-lactamase class C family)